MKVQSNEVREPVGDDWVDLLALDETGADTPDGTGWKKKDGKWTSALVVGGASQFGLPLTTNGGYDLEAELTFDRGQGSFEFHLPLAGRSVGFGFGEYFPAAIAGLSLVNGKEMNSNENPTRTTHEEVKVGQRFKIAITVRIKGDQVEFSGTVDGIEPIHWTGPLTQMSRHKNWIVPIDQIGVATWQSQYTLHKLRFKKIEGKAEIIKRLPLVEVREPVGVDWIDLLTLNEKWSDTPSGAGWRKKDGKWTSIIVPNRQSMVRIPLAATGGYDLEAEITNDEGERGAFGFGLPIGKEYIGFGMNLGGNLAGLSWINGKTLGTDENPTRTPHDPFKIGQRIKIVVSVRVKGDQADISATVDGIKPIRWSGSISALSHEWHEWATDRFVLGTAASQYTVHALRFKKVDGKAEIIKNGG